MDITLIINPITLIIEICVVLLGLGIALKKGKRYGWLIALTFACYVIYDFARFVNLNFSSSFLSLIFLVASVSILAAVVMIMQEL